MYQSDYPHGECEWPESVNIVKAWEPEVGKASMEKLLGGNAERYLRLI